MLSQMKQYDAVMMRSDYIRMMILPYMIRKFQMYLSIVGYNDEKFRVYVLQRFQHHIVTSYCN